LPPPDSGHYHLDASSTHECCLLFAIIWPMWLYVFRQEMFEYTEECFSVGTLCFWQ
jgi:hypothetical protein